MRLLGYGSQQANFSPFTPVEEPKIKNLKKWKRNTWRYCNFTLVYQKSGAFDVLLLGYGSQQANFSPFTPMEERKIKHLKKWKKNTWRYIVILHQHTKNHELLVYGYWVTAVNRSNLSIMDHFLTLLSPVEEGKFKIFNKWKTHLEICHHFTTEYKK